MVASNDVYWIVLRRVGPDVTNDWDEAWVPELRTISRSEAAAIARFGASFYDYRSRGVIRLSRCRLTFGVG